MPAAARLNDEIGHTSLLGMICKIGAGLVVGIAVAAAVGVAATAIVGATALTGGAALVAVAVVSSVLMRFGPSQLIAAAKDAINNLIDDLIPPEITGKIAQGSRNVFINGLPAARALAAGPDNLVLCSKHPPNPPKYLAEGSGTVFINSFPAHRKGDRTMCDAKTASGSSNVFIGGKAVQTRQITSEIPPWLQKVEFVIGIALALCTRDWKSIPGKLACLGVNMAIGYAADAVVGAAFGEPVHAATGAKLLNGESDTDFALPARVPLIWVRRYNSLDTRDGLLGPGWSLPISVQLRLHQSGDHPNLYIDEQGREIPFDTVAPATSQWNTAEGYRLARTIGGHYVVEDEAGLLREFGPALGKEAHTLPLLSLQDRNGNAIGLRYHPDGRLHQITDEAGRLYECTYLEASPAHPPRLSAIQVTLPDQSTHTLVRYSYDAQGCLSQVQNALDHTVRRFTWHTQGPGAGLMASHTLPEGQRCHYEWAAFEDHPRVVRHWTDDGEQAANSQPTQHWDVNYQLPGPGAEGQTHVTDHLGRELHWHWNVRFQITRHTDALGRTWQMDWNEHGLLAQSTQPNGGVWQNTYDAQQRLIAQTAPDGAKRSTDWHSVHLLPLGDTDELGHETAYEYDDLDNLIAVTAPQGRTEFTLDRHGQLVVQRDVKGGLQQWLWGAQGELLQTIDCSRQPTHYTYDAWGQLQTETNALGHTTQFEHDLLGRPLRVVQADGGEHRWNWAISSSHPLSHTDPKGHTTRYAWGTRGQLLQRTNPLGHTLQYRYDAAGNLTQLINENHQAHRFEYDRAGQLTAQVGIDGLRTEYTLNEQGLPITVCQGANIASTSKTKPITTQLERDIRGRLITKREGQTLTRIEWDKLGQPTRISRYQTDSNKPQAEPKRQDQIEWAYNPAGQVVREHSQAQLPEHWNLSDQPAYDVELLHEYDALGNRTATTLPQGQKINYLHYGSGHLHQINLDGEVVTDIERDSLHRATQRSQGAGLLTQVHYDAMGRKTQHWSQHKSGAGATHIRKRYAYDRNGELTARHDELIGTQRFTHDALGQITQAQQLTEGQEHSHSLNKPRQLTQLNQTLHYDAAANLLNSDWHSSGQPIANNRITTFEDKRYRYDEHGRLIEKLSGTRGSAKEKCLSLRYNDEHQLIESETTGHALAYQQTRYHYDALGRRIAKCDHFGVTQFAWDGMRMQQESRKHRSHTYIYEPNSHEPLARLDTPAPKVTHITLKPAQVLHFHNHINGAPEELTNTEGQVVWRARYTTWGNLALQDYPQETPDPTGLGLRDLPQNLRMQGQYEDSETGLYYNTFRYYDPEIGRFISQDPIGLAGGSNLYQFAANTNSWIDPWGLNPKQRNPAPGRPTPQNTGGYFEPGKGSGHYQAYPDFGGQKGWIDKHGNLWVPTGEGNLAHGGPHYDVQKKGGKGYGNVYPGGKLRGGWKGFPRC
jgi:RHS repeat-associated protein